MAAVEIKPRVLVQQREARQCNSVPQKEKGKKSVQLKSFPCYLEPPITNSYGLVHSKVKLNVAS